MAGTDENPIVYPPLEMPDNVEREKITIYSMGVALDGDIYRPKGLAAEDKIPGIVMSHGVGGDKLTCERYAAKFAASGKQAISFSHASWAGSQGRLLPVGDLPEVGENNEMTARVKMVRELIDPLEWVDSYRSALDYLEGEPNIDAERLGAWGTSFGGGVALYTAATDDRVKALSIQVPATFNPPEMLAQFGRQRAIQIARGDFDAIPQSTDALPNLRGTPHFARMIRYLPGDKANEVNVPTLILDAENEEMFDTTQSGKAAYEKINARGVESYYEILPDIDHYGIYFGGYERGSQLACDWFNKYL